MIFDDDFLQLTGQKDVDSIKVDEKPSDDVIDDIDVKAPEKAEPVKKWISNSDKSSSSDSSGSVDTFNINANLNSSNYSSEYGNSDYDYVIESDLVTPVIQAVKDENAKPLVVCVDDDFDTLDLLDIYLKRDYEYQAFSGPREAIFFLNQRVPQLVLIDCKIHTMRAKTFMEIIRAGAGNENVKFVFTGTEDEFAEINWDFVPEYVIGKLKRPIARGELQKLLDKAEKEE